MAYTKQEIDDYRQKFFDALCNVKEYGKPYLTKEQAQEIVDGYTDKILAQQMQYSTPEQLAEICTF